MAKCLVWMLTETKAVALFNLPFSFSTIPIFPILLLSRAITTRKWNFMRVRAGSKIWHFVYFRVLLHNRFQTFSNALLACLIRARNFWLLPIFLSTYTLDLYKTPLGLVLYFYFLPKKIFKKYLQWTLTIIRLLTDGGMLFDAIHRYAPISERVILANLSISPWYVVTETKKKEKKKITSAEKKKI